eukprot:4766795-Lingulodinium_polyedra.AAC.1
MRWPGRYGAGGGFVSLAAGRWLRGGAGRPGGDDCRRSLVSGFGPGGALRCGPCDSPGGHRRAGFGP